MVDRQVSARGLFHGHDTKEKVNMRTYPTNSPQSAARIVALTLVADGHVSPEELDALERLLEETPC